MKYTTYKIYQCDNVEINLTNKTSEQSTSLYELSNYYNYLSSYYCNLHLLISGHVGSHRRSGTDPEQVQTDGDYQHAQIFKCETQTQIESRL
mgnify:CR=1 FL=1